MSFVCWIGFTKRVQHFMCIIIHLDKNLIFDFLCSSECNNFSLQLWGQYYRDVLATPDKDDHQNIRNFMKYGWDGVDFSNGIALTKKVGTDGWDWDAESFIP